MSEFLVLTSAFARAPALAIIAAFGLLVAFGALLLRLNQIAFGEPTGAMTPVRASYVPIFAHLALVLGGDSSCRQRCCCGFRTSRRC